MPPCRTQPQISLNQLGLYLEASPARRRRIVYDQKYPKDFRAIYYKEAERSISEFICSGLAAETFRAERQRLALISPRSPQDVVRLRSNIEALERFNVLSARLNLSSAVPQQASRRHARITLHGVVVKVRPEIALSIASNTGPAKNGLIKLYLSKTHPLGEESGQFIASLLRHYAESNLPPSGFNDYRHTCIVDVFEGQIHAAPRAVIRRLSEIEAACQEIASRWSSL